MSASNPGGSITNSDLEHAGLLGQVDVMVHHRDMRYATIWNTSDNTPAVSRVTKGAVSSDGPVAYLCDHACLHQRLHRYCHKATYLPGDANVMADDASCLQHLSNTAFLAHFNQNYPQETPWHLLHLKPQTASELTSALL